MGKHLIVGAGPVGRATAEALLAHETLTAEQIPRPRPEASLLPAA